MTKTKEIEVPSLIRQIVGRCHVADSNRMVIKYVISRLKQGYKTYRAYPREQRRLLLRQIIAQHAHNLDEYRFVMGGHGYTGRYKAKKRKAHE